MNASEQDSEGDGTKGERTQGDGTKGDGTKGERTKGDGTKGDGTKGDGTKGERTKGERTKGENTTLEGFHMGQKDLDRRAFSGVTPHNNCNRASCSLHAKTQQRLHLPAEGGLTEIEWDTNHLRQPDPVVAVAAPSRPSSL
jgi:hypothetical protein